MPAAGVLLGRLPWARAEELPDYGLLRSTLPSFFPLLRACFAYDFCARWILPVLAGTLFFRHCLNELIKFCA